MGCLGNKLVARIALGLCFSIYPLLVKVCSCRSGNGHPQAAENNMAFTDLFVLAVAT